jgi:hypothetical protein
MSQALTVARMLGDQDTAKHGLGIFAGVEGSQALVDYHGIRMKMSATGSTWPAVGRPVRVLVVNGKYMMLGESAPRHAVGEVVSLSTDGALAVVEAPSGSGKTYTVSVVKGLLLTVGDVVALDWASGGVATAALTGAPALVAPVAPVPVAALVRTYRETFYASDTASWKDGVWQTSQVYYNSSFGVGAWFYGGQINSTIPDNAKIEGCEIYLAVRDQYGSNQALIGTHVYDERPSGDFELERTFGLEAKVSGWYRVPISWLNFLKANPGGVGTKGAKDGVRIFESCGDDSLSGALRVTWRS